MIREGTKIVEAIQVTYDFSNPRSREREITGLKAAIEKFELPQGTIVTVDTEETVGKIKVVPIWKYFLGL